MKINTIGHLVKTNPIQSQFKANTNPIPEKPKMKLNSYSTKDYERNDIFAVPENKPNSNPIQTQSNPISNPVGRVGFSPPILFSKLFLAFTFLCPIYNLAMQNWTIQKLLN